MVNNRDFRPVKHPDVRRAHRFRNGLIASVSWIALLWIITFICHMVGIDPGAQDMLNSISIIIPGFSPIVIGPMIFGYVEYRSKADKIEWDNHVNDMKRLEQENHRQKMLTQKILQESGINIDPDLLKAMG